MALPQKRIKHINLPKVVEGQPVDDQYEVVPEMLGKNGYSAELPTLTGNATIAISTDTKTPLVSGTTAASVTLDPYKVYNFGTLNTAMTITFSDTGVISGYCVEYSFRFTAGTNAEITLPSGCVYGGGAAPTFVAGHIYEYNIIDNLVVVGEFF